jgi:DNA mismatch endonuclease (patch repair protein)
MERQSTRDTAPELALRSELSRRGLRYRIHLRPVEGLRREADIVFTAARLAVFVDGCFWHGCADHRSGAKQNSAWWRSKIEENRRRDADTDERLREAGWTSIRVWEHEPAQDAAERIEVLVRERRGVKEPRVASST